MPDRSRSKYQSVYLGSEFCLTCPQNVGWSPMHSELLDPGNQKIGDFKEYTIPEV
jgi:hypothetical protein